MADNPTYYELLGVESGASQAEIKSAFRHEAKRQHPDQGGNAAVFRLVEDAYEVLISPARRTEYDRSIGLGDHTPPRGVPQVDADEDRFSPDDWGGDEWGANKRDQTGASGWRQNDANERNAGPQFVTAKPSKTYVPEWVPKQKLKRRFVAFAIFAYLGFALALNGTIVPGSENTEVLAFIIWMTLAYFLGSFILRLAAWSLAIFVVVSLFFGAMSGGTAIALSLVAFGLWIVGQWYYTFRKGKWKSTIARNLITRLPVWVQPDRRWTGL